MMIWDDECDVMWVFMIMVYCKDDVRWWWMSGGEVERLIEYISYDQMKQYNIEYTSSDQMKQYSIEYIWSDEAI